MTYAWIYIIPASLGGNLVKIFQRPSTLPLELDSFTFQLKSSPFILRLGQ